MKTTFISLILLISLKSFSQTSDILYVPDQKSLVATYAPFHPLGFYIGGYLVTSFPQPFIYTTPMSIINRLGVNINHRNKISVMGGAYIQNFQDSLSLKPDIWLKINPLRTLLKTDRGFDFSFGINYMEKFRYAVGLSIPFGGIYGR